MNLEEEAEKYAENKSSNPSFRNTHIRDFIAGATSKYVQKQRIEAIIWNLEELRNSETIYYIDTKIDELEQQLKKLEDGK